MATNKTVVIAGGAGFLGSHLCARYLIDGNRVICVDNLSTGRESNLSSLVQNPDFTFVRADICKPFEGKLPSNIDIILNMASPASPPHYQRLALETLQVGAQGSQRLLELAKTTGARYFFASTSEVYGDPLVHPQVESYKGNVNCYGPRSMYDESKRFGEAIAYVYRHTYNVDTVIARFFNTYGPNMDPLDGRVVSNFIMQALRGEPLTIYGDGSQTRSFCYVHDLVEGIVRLVDSGEQGPMNLGNPGEFTVRELAEKVIELTRSSSTIEYRELPGDDPLQRKPDIGYAKKALGWEPAIQLEQGLRKTIDYFASLA